MEELSGYLRFAVQPLGRGKLDHTPLPTIGVGGNDFTALAFVIWDLPAELPEMGDNITHRWN